MTKSVQNSSIEGWVDVGGTWTRFWISDSKGRLLKKNRIPTNLKYLNHQIHRFFKSPSWLCQRITIGMRGVWTDSDRRTFRRELKLKNTEVRVISDAELHQKRLLGNSNGILIIAGTGSIAIGQNGKKVSRAGGLGPLIGDDGSGFWIGREALRQRLPNDWKKVRSLSVGADPVRRIAALAAGVVRRAHQNHRPSKKIISEAQLHLLKLAEHVRDDLKMKSPPLVMTGGLFSSKYFFETFKAKARKKGFRV